MKNIGFTRVNLQNHNEKSDFFFGGGGGFCALLLYFYGSKSEGKNYIYYGILEDTEIEKI